MFEEINLLENASIGAVNECYLTLNYHHNIQRGGSIIATYHKANTLAFLFYNQIKLNVP